MGLSPFWYPRSKTGSGRFLTLWARNISYRLTLRSPHSTFQLNRSAAESYTTTSYSWESQNSDPLKSLSMQKRTNSCTVKSSQLLEGQKNRYRHFRSYPTTAVEFFDTLNMKTPSYLVIFGHPVWLKNWRNFSNPKIVYDNAAFATCFRTEEYWRRNNLRKFFVEIPAYPPDMNKIENLWAVLKRRVKSGEKPQNSRKNPGKWGKRGFR